MPKSVKVRIPSHIEDQMTFYI